ncbi:hypothetical protein GP486_000337 [Trichoglossum hirsutum]|uniref:Uncharacterized protein n=1 Tax=Trichoglossum hirsutum TaxID=265104 RepID=A0A9P8LJ33_9PEZI|nr:hypothetical protein GP486_000337 [Trichoglossum hirsutum]
MASPQPVYPSGGETYLASPQLGDTAERLPEIRNHGPEERLPEIRNREAAGFWLSRKCLIATIVLLVVVIAAVAGGVGGALAHRNRQRTGACDPSTNDQLSTIPIPAWFYWGQTASQISSLLNKYNARLTQIRIDDPSVPTFTVSMIQNTGAYQSGWWWYYGYTADALSPLLDGKRLISIDPYFDASSNLRFAVVMVPNDGPQNRGWWWYYGIDSDTVNSLLQKNQARLIALRAYNDHGVRHFAIIMISNTAQDFRNSEWYYGVSIQEISSRIDTGLRPIAISPDPFGQWDTILVSWGGENWSWYYGLSGQAILDTMGKDMTRLVDVSNYILNGALVFSVAETENG